MELTSARSAINPGKIAKPRKKKIEMKFQIQGMKQNLQYSVLIRQSLGAKPENICQNKPFIPTIKAANIPMSACLKHGKLVSFALGKYYSRGEVKIMSNFKFL